MVSVIEETGCIMKDTPRDYVKMDLMELLRETVRDRTLDWEATFGTRGPCVA
jgi:hypothetical protein